MTIIQKPNLPLVVALFAMLLERLTQGSNIEHIFYAIATAAFLYWALTEITTGVNLLRRALGVLVFGFVGYGLITRILQ